MMLGNHPALDWCYPPLSHLTVCDLDKTKLPSNNAHVVGTKEGANTQRHP